MGRRDGWVFLASGAMGDTRGGRRRDGLAILLAWRGEKNQQRAESHGNDSQPIHGVSTFHFNTGDVGELKILTWIRGCSLKIRPGSDPPYKGNTSAVPSVRA
jgi:hypothetical protein